MWCHHFCPKQMITIISVVRPKKTYPARYVRLLEVHTQRMSRKTALICNWARLENDWVAGDPKTTFVDAQRHSLPQCGSAACQAHIGFTMQGSLNLQSSEAFACGTFKLSFNQLKTMESGCKGTLFSSLD